MILSMCVRCCLWLIQLDLWVEKFPFSTLLFFHQMVSQWNFNVISFADKRVTVLFSKMNILSIMWNCKSTVFLHCWLHWLRSFITHYFALFNSYHITFVKPPPPCMSLSLSLHLYMHGTLIEVEYKRHFCFTELLYFYVQHWKKF